MRKNMNLNYKEIFLMISAILFMIIGSIFSFEKIMFPIAFGLSVYNIISSRYVFKNNDEKNKMVKEWVKIFENWKKIKEEDFDINYDFDDYIFTRFLRLISFVIWFGGVSPEAISSMKSLLDDYAVIQNCYQYE